MDDKYVEQTLWIVNVLYKMEYFLCGKRSSFEVFRWLESVTLLRPFTWLNTMDPATKNATRIIQKFQIK